MENGTKEINGNATPETNGNDTTAKSVKVTLSKTAVIVLGVLLGLVAINAIVSFMTSIIN